MLQHILSMSTHVQLAHVCNNLILPLNSPHPAPILPLSRLYRYRSSSPIAPHGARARALSLPLLP